MDQYDQIGFVRRFVRRTGATRAGAIVYGVIQEPLDKLVYRISSGRTTLTSWLAGVKISLLSTTGAKTGQQRTRPVLALPEGDRFIVIASNFGRPQHPAWYFNLRANPRATITYEGTSREVEARELEGAERDRCYALGISFYPGFVSYRRWVGKTSDRVIPVLRLEPLSESA